MNSFADVALPVSVDKVFTYLVPPELQPSAVIGVRAIVPFGRRYSTGLIVGLPDRAPIPSLKPLKDIVDPLPVVSQELLHLCRWIAEYYVSPLGEVLKAALPHGFSASHKRIVRPTASVTADLIEQTGQHAPKRARLFSLLLEHGELTSNDLQKRTGFKTINALLNDLERAGYVTTEELLPRITGKPRTRSIVQLDRIDPDALAKALEKLPARNRTARTLLESVQALTLRGLRETDLTDLLKRAGASSATIRDFRASGLIPIIRREIRREQEYGIDEQTLGLVPNAAQRRVLDSILASVDAGQPRTYLLHGVTGSGKTQVYIEAIRHCLRHGKSAIVLVPEISLTPQIVRRFKSHFGERVAVVHSRLSAGERHDVWRLALRGDCPIIIGPRSAIFAPLANLGLIIVDEEQEASYKQYDASPRYHARDVAVVRGSLAGASVVLGSATPSIESYYNAVNGKYDLLEMPERIETVQMPMISIVDMTAERRQVYATLKESLPKDQRQKLKEFRQPAISAALHQKIQDRLDRHEGIILLQNRRGFAPFVECSDCGYTEQCENCNVTLTYHLTKHHLRCHYCGLVRTPHAECPTCHGRTVQLHGIGTQRVEQELAAQFPSARVLRMDLDTTTRKGAHDRLLRAFADKEADILLGTQMVAKGLDFPHVTLVGVISADTQMLLPDFRSSERTFQLLTQVAGRAGRSTLLGEVVIQTHQPGHYTLQHVVEQDFRAFYGQEVEARQAVEYPPFSRLALIETRGTNEDRVRALAERIARLLRHPSDAFCVLGPSPAVIGKINRQFRWHLIIKDFKSRDPAGAHFRQSLHHALKTLDQRKSDTRIIIDVDPVGLM